MLLLVPDPCVSDPCDVNAVCLREGLFTDRFTCICQPPFTEGTGFNCSGMNYTIRYDSSYHYSQECQLYH